jgi:parallel beta-helix repeat protein
MKRKAIFGVLVSFLLAGAPLSAKAPIHVDDDGSQHPGAYVDIESALADAEVGQTILVHDGVYPGAIDVLTDRVSLRAAGNAVLDASVFPPQQWEDAGIVVHPGVSGVTIQGFEIRDYGAGIVVIEGANDIVIKSNTVLDAERVGIVLGLATANSIIGNQVIRCGAGIVLIDATENKIRENRVSHTNANGIVLFDTSGNNEVVGNSVTVSGGYGITLTNLAINNVVKDNQVAASGLTHSLWKDGIRVAGHENEIKDNDVYDSREDGIGIRGNGNLVKDNTVLGSGRFGISALYPITNDNLIWDNMVVGSMVFDLYDDGWGTGNVWRDNHYATSNF